LTFSYTTILLQPLLTHSPPVLLAKQYLQTYQHPPVFTPALILPSTLSNAYLSYSYLPTPGLLGQLPKTLYVLASILSVAAIPATPWRFELIVEFTATWEMHQLVREEGY
ncbi:hypothetical protein P154DRAFT_407607, partial [Amniculicola lignicola CBS 123094]